MRLLWGPCEAFAAELVERRLLRAHVRFLPGSCEIFLGLLQFSCEALVELMRDSCGAPVGLLRGFYEALAGLLWSSCDAPESLLRGT